LIETPTAAPVKNLPATVPRVPPTGSTPETISRAEPEYSQEAWDEGIQGEITVRADIEADGSMTNVKVEHSLGYGLDEKAVECAKKWRFKPGTDRGRPVKMVTIIRLPFILPDKRPERPSAGPVARPVPPPRLPSSQLKRPTDLDDFFYLVAINFKAPEVCGKIDPMAEGRGGWSSKRGSEIWSLQSNCYRLLAGELRNPKLCDHVRPVRTDFLDGSKLDKTYCLTNMDSLHETISPNDYHMEPFVSFMRKMGYTDAQVQEYWCWNSSYHDVAGYAYKKLSEEKAFLDQVHSGPSYAEARSEARIRPAHAAEFLYQMVAEDTKDPNLCAKISPNATYAAWRGHTFLLRSHCYLSFALSERNTAFCDKLPQAGTSSHIDAENDSRQGCLDTVAIFSRPESRDELLAHGPLPFPQPVYLDKALEQIGYRRARTADLLPKPEPKDYEGFLFEMSLSGGPQKRATLIGRVMNLK
jgi:TonB family protein